jgi:capsular polysaccharide biosynthesis protein
MMEEISLREIIEVVWKGKWLIALITIAALILTGIATYIMLPGTQSVVAIIELNYPGIEMGLNPDGSKFDIRQLKSPYVIEKSLKETGLNATGIKPDEVRRNIDITSIIPNDVAQRAETAIKQGNDYVYYPSEFKITYKVNKAFSYNQGIALVETIIDEYQKYFYSLYSGVEVIENTIGQLNYDKYDYYDIVQVITTQIEGIQEFLQTKIEENNSFRSAETGHTFADLNRSFEILKTVNTSKLESLVNANTLTKDRHKLIKDYQYRLKRMELEQAKKQSEAEEARKLMEQYKREDFVLIPDSQGNELRLENPQSYYNILAETAIAASVEAANLKHEIDYYRNEVSRLIAVSESINTQLIEEANKMIDEIQTRIETLISVTNKTIEDYYAYRYGTSIRQVTPAQVVTGMKVLLNLAIAVVIGLMIGVSVVFMRHYWKSTEPVSVKRENGNMGDIPQQE